VGDHVTIEGPGVKGDGVVMARVVAESGDLQYRVTGTMQVAAGRQTGFMLVLYDVEGPVHAVVQHPGLRMLDIVVDGWIREYGVEIVWTVIE
jgi:hypothetical protein